MQYLSKNFVLRTQEEVVVHDPVTVTYPETSVTTTQVFEYFPGKDRYQAAQQVFDEAFAINPDPFTQQGTHLVPAHINGRTQIIHKDTAVELAVTRGDVVGVRGISVKWVMVYIEAYRYRQDVTVVTPAYSVTTPGYTETVLRVIQDPNLGWNAGARTKVVKQDNFTLDFSINPGTQNLVIGLSAPVNDVGVSFEEIEWGLQFAAGRYRVIEKGVAKTAWASNSDISGQDVFQIRRVGQRISYWREGVSLYESATLCQYPALLGDVALYAAGDAVWNAAFVEDNTAGSEIALGALATYTDYNPAYADTALQALAVSAFGFATYEQQTLTALTGVANDIPLVVWLSALETSGQGYTTLIGTAEFDLKPLAALAADYAYAEAQIALEPLATIELEPVDVLMVGFLPTFKLTAQARGDESALIGTLPGFALEAATAGRMEGVLPSWRLDATVSGDSYDTMRGTLPAFTLTAEIVSGSLAEMRGTLPLAFRLEASTGAVMVGTLPLPGGTASGLSGSVSQVRGSLPALFLDAHVTVENFAQVVGTLPLFQMVYGEVMGSLPPLLGFALVAGPDPAKVVWVTNVRAEEMTQYTQFDFLALGRLGGALYGVKADGLYLLHGDTDQGVEVPWRFSTHPNDFGTDHHKRVPYLYLGTAQGVQVRPTCDGELVGAYDSIDGRQRVRLARGAEGRYWSFDVRPAYNQPAKVDGFEPLIEQLARRV